MKQPFPCAGCGELVEHWVRFHHRPEGCGQYTTPDPKAPTVRTKDPEGRPANIVRASRFFGAPPFLAPAPGPVPKKPWPLEEDVRRDGLGFLAKLGYDVYDFEQGYRADGSSRVTNGVADAYVQHAQLGIRAWIEFKRWDNEPEAEQSAFGEAELAAGGAYLVIYEVGQLLAWHEAVRRIIPSEGRP